MPQKVVLLPVVEKAWLFSDQRLKGIEVVTAPPHVQAHVLDCREGEMIRPEACGGILLELALLGYAVEMQPRRVEILTAIEYTATQ